MSIQQLPDSTRISTNQYEYEKDGHQKSSRSYQKQGPHSRLSTLEDSSVKLVTHSARDHSMRDHIASGHAASDHVARDMSE